MKKLLLISIFISSFLFGKWGTWQKVSGVNEKNQPIEDTYMAAVYNDNELTFKSVVLIKNDGLVVGLGEKFDIGNSKTYTIKIRVDYKKDVELIGDVLTSYTMAPTQSQKYVYFDAYLHNNLEAFETLSAEMEKGRTFKIITIQDGREKLHHIPLTGFSTIYKSIE